MIPNRDMLRHPEKYGITFVSDPVAGAGGGGGTTAVLDKPAAGLTPDADPDKGNAPELDAEGKPVSPETPNPDDKSKTPVLDEDTEAIVAARIEEDRQAREREQLTLKEQQDAEAAEQAHLDELRTHYTTHESQLKAKIAGIGVTVTADMVGKILHLDAALQAELLGELSGYDKDAASSIGLRLRDTLTRQVLATVPEAEREAVKKTLDRADPKEFARAIGEAYAPRAAALQELDLDGVLGLSAKAKRGHAEAIKVAKDEAKRAERERIYALHGITQDEPETGGAAGGGQHSSLTALNAARVAGTINDADFLKEQNRLLGIS